VMQCVHWIANSLILNWGNDHPIGDWVSPEAEWLLVNIESLKQHRDLVMKFDDLTVPRLLQVLQQHYQKPTMDTNEAADYLGVSDEWLKKARQTGCINGHPVPMFIKIGRKVKYLKHDLDSYLDSLKKHEHLGQVECKYEIRKQVAISCTSQRAC